MDNPRLGTIPPYISANVTTPYHQNDCHYFTLLPNPITDLALLINRGINLNKKIRNHSGLIPGVMTELAYLLELFALSTLDLDLDFNSTITCYNMHASYHTDPEKIGYNATIVLRSNTKGGYITIPSIDTHFEMAHASLLIFPASKLMHGVTPIETITKGEGYRNSIIFYRK